MSTRPLVYLAAILILVFVSIVALGRTEDDDSSSLIEGSFASDPALEFLALSDWRESRIPARSSDPREPGEPPLQPVLAYSDGSGRTVAFFRVDPGPGLNAVVEEWTDRFAGTLEPWRALPGHEAIAVTTSGELTGPGPGGFMHLTVIRIETGPQAWVLTCSSPRRADEVCERALDLLSEVYLDD